MLLRIRKGENHMNRTPTYLVMVTANNNNKYSLIENEVSTSTLTGTTSSLFYEGLSNKNFILMLTCVLQLHLKAMRAFSKRHLFGFEKEQAWAVWEYIFSLSNVRYKHTKRTFSPVSPLFSFY